MYITKVRRTDVSSSCSLGHFFICVGLHWMNMNCSVTVYMTLHTLSHPLSKRNTQNKLQKKYFTKQCETTHVGIHFHKNKQNKLQLAPQCVNTLPTVHITAQCARVAQITAQYIMETILSTSSITQDGLRKHTTLSHCTVMCR